MMQWLVDHWSWSNALWGVLGSAAVLYLKGADETQKARMELMAGELAKTSTEDPCSR